MLEKLNRNEVSYDIVTEHAGHNIYVVEQGKVKRLGEVYTVVRQSRSAL